MENKPLKKAFSFYPNLKEARNYPITIEELYQEISSDSYKSQITAYRAHLAKGEKAEAQRIKSSLPCVMVAGICPGMHTDSAIAHPTGYLSIDVDGLPLGKGQELQEKVRTLNYVVLSFITPSYGLKIIVATTHDGWERYRAIYALIAAVVGNELGVKVDMSSENPSRLSFLSYDPMAYFNPNAIPFDWKGLELFPDRAAQLRAQADGWRKQTAQPLRQTAQPTQQPAAAATAPVGSGFVTHTLLQFFHYNPWVKGERNKLLLRLGRRLKSKGFSQSELNRAIAWVVQNYAESDCTKQEIRSKITAGYNYVKVSEKDPNLVSRCQGVTMFTFETSELEEFTEDVDDTNEALRKESPFFDEKVFENLPPLLSRVLGFSSTKRERDILLMSTLTNLSAAIPNVEFSYFNRMNSPHLFFLAVAQPGSGKGIATLSPLLLKSIEAHLEKENKRMEKEYKRLFQKWELEKRKALKEGRVPNAELEPEEPKKRYLSVPANTSKNQFIIALADNQPYGLIINASELDLLVGAVTCDYGGHDAVFRQAFHSETLGSHFKIDKRIVLVEKPCLALCLSGTPDQAIKFLPSQENGMASRVSLYFSHANPKFLSPAPDPSKKDLERQFAEMAEEVFQNYLYLERVPTEVEFTPEQWEKHIAFFNQRLQEVAADHKCDTLALVFRSGFIALRIAVILTTMRKCEAKWQVRKITCSDEDFNRSISIADTLLHHGLLFSTMQQGSVEKKKAGEGIFRMKRVLGNLLTKFTFSEIVEEAAKYEVSRSAVIRYLRKMIEMELIVKEKNIYVKTRKYWPKKVT